MSFVSSLTSQRVARLKGGRGGEGGEEERGGRAKRPMTFQTNYLYWICFTSKINADNVNKKNRNYCELGSLGQLQTRIP